MTNGNEPMYPAMDFNQHADGSGNMELRYEGLTKREYFAAMALQGITANPKMIELLRLRPEDSRHGDLAQTAVLAAEALIAALNTTKQQDNG